MYPAIIDYGMGNLRSVANACEALGFPARLTNRPQDLRDAGKVLLPGVGAFGDGMSNLRDAGWVEFLEEEVRSKGKPFLGLCLGMQLLATKSLEYGEHVGLGWVPGIVRRLKTSDPSLRIPHIGWNDVTVVKADGLYDGQEGTPVFYFVHSYVFYPDDPGVVSGTCVHGTEFPASVETGNIFAAQFHPEKSQECGLAYLKNFLELKD